MKRFSASSGKKELGCIPKFHQNAIFGLSIFAIAILKKVRNRTGYSSLFLKWQSQKSSRPKPSILKELGYTLIEIMIALSVFAIIATISASVMYHVFDIRKRVATQANQLNELQVAVTLMEHDITQFVPRTVRTVDMHIFSSFVGTHQYMEFTQGGVVNPKGMERRSTLKRVAFLCKGKGLIRRSWSVLDTLDRHQFEDKQLLSDIESCSFDYVTLSHQTLSEWRGYRRVEQSQKFETIPSGIQITMKPTGWGKFSFLFVLPEGLYAF